MKFSYAKMEQWRLKQWNRKPPHIRDHRCIADLEGDGTMEVINSTGNAEVICLEGPLMVRRPRMGRFKDPVAHGRAGNGQNAAYKQDGVLVADLDQAGRRGYLSPGKLRRVMQALLRSGLRGSSNGNTLFRAWMALDRSGIWAE